MGLKFPSQYRSFLSWKGELAVRILQRIFLCSQAANKKPLKQHIARHLMLRSGMPLRHFCDDHCCTKSITRNKQFHYHLTITPCKHQNALNTGKCSRELWLLGADFVAGVESCRTSGEVLSSPLSSLLRLPVALCPCLDAW